MAKTLFIEDTLIGLLIKKLNLHWEEDKTWDYLAYENGDVFGAEDYEYIDIPNTTIEWEKGGTLMNCDGILFFGDGCMEFHDADACEAFHWSEFTDKSILEITKIVTENV